MYRAVSREVREIFSRYTPLIEPLSLDEAYLDVTADQAGLGSATSTAEAIRRAIREELALTASAGVSYNKFIAKIASDQNKPDGICVVRPEEGADFVAGLPARRFFGVGPKTAERMAALGIRTGADLRERSLGFLEQHFGKSARYLYHACRGEDDRPVRPNRERKSIGAERTYAQDLVTDAALSEALEGIIDTVWPRIEAHRARGRTITLKIKFADFQQITRARSLRPALDDRETFARIARGILQGELPVSRGVRLLGLTLSGLEGLDGEETEEPAVQSDGVREARPRQQTLVF